MSFAWTQITLYSDSYYQNISHKTTMRISSIHLLLSLIITSLLHHSQGATSVTRHGITWHFDAEYEIGQYANGDFYVVENSRGGGVTITSTSPPYELKEGTWHRNGSMINPVAGQNAGQGFDSSTKSWKADLNIGDNLPLNVPSGSSFVTATSKSSKNRRPQLPDFAVLTIVESAPQKDSFRPPYAGTDKTIRGNAANLDYSILRTLKKPNRGLNVPNISKVEDYFERTWYELQTQWVAQHLHPSNNMPSYGRDMAKQLELGIFCLLLNFSEEKKKKLFVRLVQYGIDLFGAAKSGGVWQNNGGHNHGRKIILILAAKALNDLEILEYGDAKKYLIFGEDQQTFYVNQRTIDITNGSKWKPDQRNGVAIPYSTSDIGLAEWGIQHRTFPNGDNKAWSAIYRTVVGGSQIGLILAARIMEFEDEWNHPPIFDYFDRYWEIEKDKETGGTNRISKLAADMWHEYRYIKVPMRPDSLQIN